jgi:hypothetical protein
LVWFSHQLLKPINYLPPCEVSSFVEEWMAHENALDHFEIIISDMIILFNQLI